MNTLFTGHKLIELAKTGSTNDYALNTILPEGAVVWAHEQSAGKGQRGNSWQSEPGKNLTFSLVLQPVFLGQHNQFYLSKITAIALVHSLAGVLKEVRIKWPNDIYYKRKKTGGVLVENVWSGNKLQRSVIGVGINVNQQEFDPGLNAVSIRMATGKETGIKDHLTRFCEAFEPLYLQLKSGNFTGINERYHSLLMNYGEEAVYRDEKGEFTAVIRSVNDSGLVELYVPAENRCRLYEMKQVSLVI